MDAQALQLKRYLLGELSDDERNELDLRLLTDSDFSVLVELAEEDLIEDYLDQSLTPQENESFERHFLGPPERYHQLSLSRQLREYARGSAPALAEKKPDTVPTTNGSFLRFHPILAFSFAAALLAAVAGVSYLLWQNRVPGAGDPRSIELARVNERDLSNLSGIQNVSRLSLVPRSAREPSSLSRISLQTTSETILLRLGLPNDWSGRSASVQLVSRKSGPLRLEGAMVYQSEAGKDLRILVPRAFLTVDRYRIEVRPEENPGQVITYIFDVES